MLDAFDYKEPACLLCDGESFYYHDPNKAQGTVPISNVIIKIDELLNREEYSEVERILKYWLNESIALNDKRGELSILNEMMGLYRKLGDKENALNSSTKALALIDELGINELVSTATILINIATVFKAFELADKSLPIFRKAELIYLKEMDGSDPLFGSLYNNYGLALADCGKTEEAEGKYHKAIKVMETDPSRFTECAITYLNLADLYYDDDDKASVYCEKAVEHLTDKRVSADTYTAFVYKKCAPALKSHGYFLIAKQLEEKAEFIYERSGTE